MIQRNATSLLRLLDLVDWGSLDGDGEPTPITTATVVADIYTKDLQTKLTPTPISLSGGVSGYGPNDYIADFQEPTNGDLGSNLEVWIVYTATSGGSTRIFRELSPVRD